MLLLALALLPARAPGATLEVRGPDGAKILVDGQERGQLPLARPLEVEAGYRVLRCTLGGHLAHEETFFVPSEYSDVVIELELRPLRRGNAVVGSALLAGTGQLYERRKKMGWTMMALQLGAVATALVADARVQSLSDDVSALQTQYSQEIDPAEIVRLRNERDAAYDDIDAAQTLRNLGIGAAIAVGLWSVVDAWLGFDAVYLEPTIPPTSSAESPALRLAWRARF